jgi:hypothetical protein
VVRGVRRRRWALVVAAGLVFVYWGYEWDVIWNLRQIEWARVYPFGMLLRHAEADRFKAVDELGRRINQGLLTQRQQVDVFEILWEKEGRGGGYRIPDYWRRVVAALERQGALPDDCQRKVISRFSAPTMTVRDVIRQSEPLVIRIDFKSNRSRVFDYHFWHEPIELRVGGNTIYVANGNGWRVRDADWVRSDLHPVLSKVMQFDTAGLEPGRWAVEYVCKHILRYRPADCSTSTPSWSTDVRLTGEVEILPAEASDPVRCVSGLSLGCEPSDILTVCLDQECLPSTAAQSPARVRRLEGVEFLFFDFYSHGLHSVPLAFELIIEAGGRILPVQTLRIRPQGEGQGALAWHREQSRKIEAVAVVHAFDEGELYVVLRASRDVARQTVDLYEIWNGELRFGPFEVKHVDMLQDSD